MTLEGAGCILFSRRWPARWNKTDGEKHGSQAGELGPANDLVSRTARETKSIGRSDEGKAHVNYTGSHVTLYTAEAAPRIGHRAGARMDTAQ